MSETLHHIRLLAGFEIQPGASGARTLTRADCERLATALAEDLARVEPGADRAMLVVAGSLLEPSALLCPGFSPWEALGDLAQPAIREHGASGQILAIGAHHGRFPDARLGVEDPSPGGLFLAVPILLVVTEPGSTGLRSRLEERLFEKGGVSPPARSVLAETTGFDTVHGQLMTLADLLALQHIQMDTAGMGAFWPVVEHVLVNGEERFEFPLPARLEAVWQPERAMVLIRFLSFDQYADKPDQYALWVRAFRSLCALLDNHDIAWQADSSLDHDADHDCLAERAGSVDRPDSLTEQAHADCGLVAWTLIKDRTQINLYPLSTQAIVKVASELGAGLVKTENAAGICYDADTLKLRAAP